MMYNVQHLTLLLSDIQLYENCWCMGASSVSLHGNFGA